MIDHDAVATDWDRYATILRAAIDAYPNHAGESPEDLLSTYAEAVWNATYWTMVANGADHRDARAEARAEAAARKSDARP